jgi:plastocyanin
MKTALRQSIATLALLSVLAIATPVQAASSASISMVDVQSFDPVTFFFPGGPAFGYHPGLATVTQRGTVNFHDNGWEPHTVTSYTNVNSSFVFEGVIVTMPIPDGKFDSGVVTPIEAGDTWTLDTNSLSSGDYNYFCQFHPWMQATLRIVEDNAPDSITVNMDHPFGDNDQFFPGSGSWGFLARNLRVRQGTMVTITDNGILPHTATSYTEKFSFEVGGRTLNIPIPDGTFDSGPLMPGQDYTLNTSSLSKGTYTYFCAIHPWMLGSLTVG